MNKRALSLVLAWALCAGLTVPGFAAESETVERGVLKYTEIIAPQYDDAGRFSQSGLAPVLKDGKWGYIDTEGNTAIPFRFSAAYIFSEGKAVVADETGAAAFIDEAGNAAPLYAIDPESGRMPAYLPPDAEGKTDPDGAFFHNGFVYFGAGGGLYRQSGELLDLGMYCADGPMNEGLTPVYSVEPCVSAGWADENGSPVKVFIREAKTGAFIDRVFPFNQGLAPVYRAEAQRGSKEWIYRWGVMDRGFNWVIRPQFESFFYSGVGSESRLFGVTGLAMVKKDGRYGAVDKTGKTVIPFRYDELWPVDDGYIVFKQDGKYGYLDAADNEVAIAPQYEKASGFNRGLAVVCDGEKAYLIDKKGGEVPGADALDPSTYFVENADGSKTVYQPGEYVVIEKNGKYGYGHIEYVPALPERTEMDAWAYDEVVAAIEEGLVPVRLQNLYRSDITREEFCDLVMEAVTEITDEELDELVLEKTGKTLASCRSAYPFRDSSSENVIAANAVGIVNGRGNRVFDPYSTISRQEAAAFLQRAAKVLDMDTKTTQTADFADAEKVASYFTDAVNFVYQAEIMNGTGANSFSPDGKYTREQSYVTVYRLFRALTAAETAEG